MAIATSCGPSDQGIDSILSLPAHYHLNRRLLTLYTEFLSNEAIDCVGKSMIPQVLKICDSILKSVCISAVI